MKDIIDINDLKDDLLSISIQLDSCPKHLLNDKVQELKSNVDLLLKGIYIYNDKIKNKDARDTKIHIELLEFGKILFDEFEHLELEFEKHEREIEESRQKSYLNVFYPDKKNELPSKDTNNDSR